MRPEVTNPARHGPEFSIAIKLNVRSLPRCVIPSRFTRSYSERCVSRRVLGNENELTSFICVAKNFSPKRAVSRGSRSPDAGLRYKKKSSTEIRGKTSQTERIPATYCAGDSAGVSSAPAGDSVVVAGVSVAAGLVKSVAAGAVVGAGVITGATVSVFCSHAASSAALARMQMYFFIIENA